MISKRELSEWRGAVKRATRAEQHLDALYRIRTLEAQLAAYKADLVEAHAEIDLREP